MVRDIYKISQEFELAIHKLAAKEKTGRKKVVSALEKAKKSYSALKSSLDSLEAQADKINAQLEKTRSSCNAARKDMIKFHKAIQNMDLTNASDAVFYDSGDVGYIIDGQECHVDINEAGEITKTKMRDHRKSLKKSKDENDAVYSQDSDDSGDEDGQLGDNQFSDDSLEVDDSLDAEDSLYGDDASLGGDEADQSDVDNLIRRLIRP